MSLSGWAGGVSGAAKGFQQAGEARIANQDANNRQAEADRKGDKHEWWKGFADRMGNREAVENPQTWQGMMQGGFDQTAQGMGALVAPPQALNVMQPQVPPQGQQAMMGPRTSLLQGAAEGGAISMAPPPEQAAPPAAPQAAPQAQAPAQQGPNRRARYNVWYNDTAKYAALNGGLEGYQKFQEMENATSRKQIMGYGLQAIRAMDEGNVGEAMRAGNSALEVTPFDTGLKFTASEGKLHMQGKDGQPGPPLNARQLQAFVDDHMKTPENYLDWKKQYEVERSAGVNEGIDARNTSVNERNASVNESEERRANRFAERGMQVEEAKALSSLIAAKAASTRAAQSISDAAFRGWKTSEIQRVMSDTDDWSLKDLAEISPEVQDYYTENQLAWNNLKEDVSYLQLEQDPQQQVTRETAAIVSQLIRQPAGVDAASVGMEPGAFTVDLLEDGSLVAMKEGRPVRLTPELESIYMKKNPEAAKKIEEARKMLGDTGALPGTTPAGPPAQEEAPPKEALPPERPQWQADALKMARNDAVLQSQRDEQYAAASH